MEVAPTNPSSSTMAALAVGAAAGAGAALTASQTDVLGLLSGVLTALPAVAPPPLNMCLMPFTHALAELGLAVRHVRFNKEAAAPTATAATADDDGFVGATSMLRPPSMLRKGQPLICWGTALLRPKSITLLHIRLRGSPQTNHCVI